MTHPSGCDEPVTINPNSDLVTFDDIPSYLVPGQDVFVIYQLGSEFKPTSRDWVGVFPCGWSSLSKYLTFQWSPKEPRNPRFPNIRSVLFLGKDLQVSPSLEDEYQFLYISKQHVVGVSPSFIFSEFSPEELICSEENVGSIGPVTFVGPRPTKDKKGSENNYDLLVNSGSESDSDSDLPPLINISEDHFSLADIEEKPSPLIIVPIEVKTKPDNKETAIVPYNPAITLPIFNMNAKETEDELLRPISTIKTPTPMNNMVPVLKGAFGGPAFSVLSKSTDDKVFDDFSKLLNNLHVATPPPERPAENKTDVKTVLGGKVTKRRFFCKVCRHKADLLAEAKEQIACLKREKAESRKKLKDVKEDVDLKNLILDELANQVKHLISENANLVTMKEKLERQADWWECSSCKTKEDLTTAIETLRSGNKRLRSQNNAMESNLQNIVNERTKLNKELDSLKCQQHDFGERYASLEQHLNDIMYTLSQKGVDKIVDRNGNTTTLDMTKGKILDLDGWQVAMPKKTGKLLATISAKNEIIQDLRSANEKLESNMGSLEGDAEKLREEVNAVSSERDRLKKELDHLQHDHLDVKNQEESVSRMLGMERKDKVELIKQHKTAEKDYQNRIDSLTAALESAKIDAKAMRNQCCGTDSPTAVSTSSQSETAKTLTKEVRTADKKRTTNKARESCPKPGRTEIVDTQPPPDTTSTPLTVQTPPLTWYEFPMDLVSFVPEEPILKNNRHEPPKEPECRMSTSLERPSNPLWPFCAFKDDVKLKPKEVPKKKKEPERHSSFTPLWFESLFSFNTNKEKDKTEMVPEKDDSRSASKTKTADDDKKPADDKLEGIKKLRFSPIKRPDVTLTPDVTPTSAKAKKMRYSAKTRKAKKAEFSRMIKDCDIPRLHEPESLRSRSTSPIDVTKDFVCPYCGYFFSSGTSQMTINRHLRFHSKLNSHLG